MDPRNQFTFDLVNWDAICSVACKIIQVESAHWGEQKSGGFNLVRFLHLHDSKNTVVVARVPLRSEDTMNPKHDLALSKRIASEVATMEYVERYTNIPVPHILNFSSDYSGDVRSPYILMSKVEGIPLSSLWNDMGDDKRRMVLKQVIDILLELWSHRFEKAGALFKRSDCGEGKDAWYVESQSVLENPDAGLGPLLSTTSYPHAADYWLAYANINLRDISDKKFGNVVKPYTYAHVWFMRSLIPSLFDPSDDAHGFPLCPGDFHSQNIMIIDAENHPRINAVIDWEFTGPMYTTSFALYPFFIIDHPLWDDDHPLRKRNSRDQVTFDELILEAERHHSPVGDMPLSRYISNSYGIYLFQQLMQYQWMYSPCYPLLFKYVFGDDEDFNTDYYWNLMEKGILKTVKERFDKENSVWLAARKVLGDQEVGHDLTMPQFRDLVLQNLDKFERGGLACEWLASVH